MRGCYNCSEMVANKFTTSPCRGMEMDLSEDRSWQPEAKEEASIEVLRKVGKGGGTLEMGKNEIISYSL